jgi:hypothetical protein
MTSTVQTGVLSVNGDNPAAMGPPPYRHQTARHLARQPLVLKQTMVRTVRLRNRTETRASIWS